MPAPTTLTWETDDESAVVAKLHRTTRVSADKWGEVGPSAPRIWIRRTVELVAKDGIEARLDIVLSIFLKPGEDLPQSLDEALRRVGRGVQGGWYFRAEGGDLVPAGDHKYWRQAMPVSMESLTKDFPGYAHWPLTAQQQEAALLRHIATLPRRKPKPPPKDTINKYVEKGIDIVTDFAPIASNVKDFIIFATGRNPVTGDKVGWLGRLLSLVFAIPVLGNLLKYVGKGGRFIGKYLIVPLVRALGKGGGALVKWIAKSSWGGAAINWVGGMWRGLGKRIRSLIGAKKLKGAKAAAARASFHATQKQLQKKFKHAPHFGVHGNWNPANAANFEAALNKHVQDTANEVIKGKYHNVAAIIHVNPTTGLAVVSDLNGTFVSGWRLSAQQLKNVRAHGNLGGG